MLLLCCPCQLFFYLPQKIVSLNCKKYGNVFFFLSSTRKPKFEVISLLILENCYISIFLPNDQSCTLFSCHIFFNTALPREEARMLFEKNKSARVLSFLYPHVTNIFITNSLVILNPLDFLEPNKNTQHIFGSF